MDRLQIGFDNLNAIHHSVGLDVFPGLTGQRRLDFNAADRKRRMAVGQNKGQDADAGPQVDHAPVGLAE